MDGGAGVEVTGVSTGFEWRDTPAGSVLVSMLLEPLAPHCFSSRIGPSGDAPLEPDYAAIAATLSRRASDLVWVRQVHGRAVFTVSSDTPRDSQQGGAEADALVLLDATRAIAVRVADCVPVLLTDRHRRAVAAVHAGWRGMAAGAIGAAIAALREAGIDPRDLVGAIGPSIGPCCYQVGEAVRRTFREAWPEANDWLRADGAERWKLDLWAAASDQLEQAGLVPGAVSVARLCTAHHPEQFWSYRRDGTAAGRMVAAIAPGRASELEQVVEGLPRR
jgi:YfiH family protein